jgi:hypothetical protein
MNAKHTTPRTDAALALVSKARETEPDYKCHDALIVSHVTLEMDYNGLRAENERLREALVGVTRILEAFSYTTQLGKTQRARLDAARAALGAAS